MVKFVSSEKGISQDFFSQTTATKRVISSILDPLNARPHDALSFFDKFEAPSLLSKLFLPWSVLNNQKATIA